MRHHFPSFLLFLFPLVLLLGSVSPKRFNIPAIFNFGDSNSDTGGLSATFGPQKSPYGDTFFKMPAGRYSDGRLIIDFIAESLGLPHISSYLDSLGANFSHGSNFATSASTIIPQNDSVTHGGFSPFSLDVQLKQFLQFKHRSQIVYKKGGVFKTLLPEENYFSQALYTIDIGQNDLIAGYFANKIADEYFPDAMNRFTTTVKSLYQSGGRYFWIHNVGPIGCLAYFVFRVPLAASQLDSIGCGIVYNELAKKFNSILNETVVELRRELHGAALIYVDIYNVKYNLFSQAKKYGFEQPLRVCCKYGGDEYKSDSSITCAKTGEVNGTEVLLGRSCKDPAKSINWDGAHYTEAANKLVFDQISSGAFSDPPLPLSMACSSQTS